MSKFKLNKRGVRDLMMSNTMNNVLKEYADKIKLGSGEGYTAKRIRTRWLVGAESEKARKDNLENNTLLKQTTHQQYLNYQSGRKK